MRIHLVLAAKASLGLLLTVSALGCATTMPPPTERLANARSSVRGAEEVGATNEPQAALHMRLAQEGIAQARALMSAGDNNLADARLMRAQAEAELAVGLARAASAQADAKVAMDQVQKMKTESR